MKSSADMFFSSISTRESMRDGVLPGIRDLEQLEPDFPLPMASSQNREVALRNGLISSVGLDGHCSALVLTQYNHA